MHLYLIVLYNQNVFYSSTWISLVKLLESHPHTAKVYIWDNSSSAQHCKGDFDCLNDVDVMYHHCPQNEKLSIIYNNIIGNAFQERFEFVTILDQDSILPLDFKFKLNLINNDFLFVPTVYSNKTGALISPRYQKYNYLTNRCVVGKNNFNINEHLISSKDFFAVGSGMTINKGLWSSGVKFIEKLSFYGVDTEFCVDYAMRYDFVNLLHCDFKHDASGENEEDLNKLKWRLTKYYEHWLYQLINHSRLPKVLACLYVRTSFKYVLLKNMTNRFIKLVLKS